LKETYIQLDSALSEVESLTAKVKQLQQMVSYNIQLEFNYSAGIDTVNPNFRLDVTFPAGQYWIGIFPLVNTNTSNLFQ
jgi:hypothetical protein